MKTLSIRRILFYLLLVQVLFIACNKPANVDNSPPQIAFITTPGHIYTDAAVKRDSTIVIGYQITKSGNDLIKYVNIFCSYGGKADTLIEQITLPAGTGTSFTRDEYINTGSIGGSQKYTIEANTFLGQRSSISVTLNVY
jgi:hypothetical protein